MPASGILRRQAVAPPSPLRAYRSHCKDYSPCQPRTPVPNELDATFPRLRSIRGEIRLGVFYLQPCHASSSEEPLSNFSAAAAPLGTISRWCSCRLPMMQDARMLSPFEIVILSKQIRPERRLGTRVAVPRRLTPTRTNSALRMLSKVMVRTAVVHAGLVHLKPSLYDCS